MAKKMITGHLVALGCEGGPKTSWDKFPWEACQKMTAPWKHLPIQAIEADCGARSLLDRNGYGKDSYSAVSLCIQLGLAPSATGVRAPALQIPSFNMGFSAQLLNAVGIPPSLFANQSSYTKFRAVVETKWSGIRQTFICHWVEVVGSTAFVSVHTPSTGRHYLRLSITDLGNSNKPVAGQLTRYRCGDSRELMEQTEAATLRAWRAAKGRMLSDIKAGEEVNRLLRWAGPMNPDPFLTNTQEKP